MTADLDSLTALYVLIGDHMIASGQAPPGRPKKLTDAELVCLAVAHTSRSQRMLSRLEAKTPALANQAAASRHHTRDPAPAPGEPAPAALHRIPAAAAS